MQHPGMERRKQGKEKQAKRREEKRTTLLSTAAVLKPHAYEGRAMEL